MLDSGLRAAFAFGPTGVAAIAGIVIAVMRWRSEPTVARVSVIGFALLLAAMLVTGGVAFIDVTGWTESERNTFLTGVGVVLLVLQAIAWVLLLTALFVRLPQRAAAAAAEPVEADSAPTGRHVLLDSAGQPVIADTGAFLAARPRTPTGIATAGAAGVAGAGVAAFGTGVYGEPRSTDGPPGDIAPPAHEGTESPTQAIPVVDESGHPVDADAPEPVAGDTSAEDVQDPTGVAEEPAAPASRDTATRAFPAPAPTAAPVADEDHDDLHDDLHDELPEDRSPADDASAGDDAPAPTVAATADSRADGSGDGSAVPDEEPTEEPEPVAGPGPEAARVTAARSEEDDGNEAPDVADAAAAGTDAAAAGNAAAADTDSEADGDDAADEPAPSTPTASAPVPPTAPAAAPGVWQPTRSGTSGPLPTRTAGSRPRMPAPFAASASPAPDPAPSPRATPTVTPRPRPASPITPRATTPGQAAAAPGGETPGDETPGDETPGGGPATPSPRQAGRFPAPPAAPSVATPATPTTPAPSPAPRSASEPHPWFTPTGGDEPEPADGDDAPVDGRSTRTGG